MFKPEPAAPKSESAALKSEPVMLKPEPAAHKSEPVMLQSEWRKNMDNNLMNDDNLTTEMSTVTGNNATGRVSDAKRTPINLSLGVKFTILKTDLQAVFSKNEGEIKVLVAPTDAIANQSMSIGEVIDEIKKLMGGEKVDEENLKGEITNAVSTVNGEGKGDVDIKNVTFMIRQAFLYYYKKKDNSSGMEYAFSLEISFDNMMKEIDFLSLDSISLSLWTTKRSKIIEQMGIFNIDEYLKKYPISD